MPVYLVFGDDDTAALDWLKQKKDAWIPSAWRAFNDHSVSARKVAVEEFSNLIQSYPMGSDYRVVVIYELEKSDAFRKKQLPELLGTLIPTTVVVLWFVPGPNDPKKLPLGAEWKEVLKHVELVKCKRAAQDLSPTIFSLLDSLGERRSSKAIVALDTLLKQGEAPLQILAAVANQVRLFWQIRTMMDEGKKGDEMAKTIGIHPYRITKGIQYSRNFKPTELPKFIDWLARADLSLKTGKQEPEHLLQLLMVRICQG